VGQHYALDPSSPTHAALINQHAQEDGINPYTSQPLKQSIVTNQPDSYIPREETAGGVLAVGLGGAAISAAGSEAYHHHDDKHVADEYRQQQEEQAAFEASIIAAPDTYEQQSEQQAAREAAIIAAPDVPVPSASSFMFGGRGEGEVSSAVADLSSDAYPEHAKVGSQTQNVPNPLETVFRPLAEDLARPSLVARQNHQSVQSISQLHVPGEFPSSNNEVKDTLTAEVPA